MRPRPALRWWMLILCLLASGACWWFARFLVDPQPLWTLERTGKQYLPLYESEDQLVVTEGNLEVSNEMIHSEKVPGSLLILDRSTGKEQHRLQVLDISMMHIRDYHLPIPRLHKGALWRITSTYEYSGRVHHLLRWDYARDQKEKVVHTWKGPQQQVTWTQNNRVALISFRQSLFPLLSMMSDSAFGTLLFHKLDRNNCMPEITWWERWNVELDSEPLLRRQARWMNPIGRDRHYPNISPDGQWALFTSIWPDDYDLVQRAKRKGLTSCTAQQVVDLVRPDEREVLVYNTITGQRVSHDQPTVPILSITNWSESTFLAFSYHQLSDKDFLLSEYGTTSSQHLLLGQAAPLSHDAFSFEDGIITPLHLATEFPELRLTDSVFNKRLSCLSQSSLVELRRQGRQWSIHQQIEMSSGSLGYELNWLLNTNQAITRYEHFEPFWTEIIEQFPWTERFFPPIQEDDQERYQFSVFDNSRGNTERYVFRDQTPWSTPFLTKFLYSIRNEKRGIDIISSKLFAYEVPIRWYSHAWRWLAACLPLVLLMLYVMRRRRTVA